MTPAKGDVINATDDTDPVDVDPLALAIQAKSGRKSLGRLSDLVGRSVRLVWDAGHALFVALVALQILAAAALAGQVLAVQALLSAILDLSTGSAQFAELWRPVVLLALLAATTSVTGALQGNIQRLLGERVSRTMWHHVLDVATGVSLRHFEAAGFYDRLQRVQSSAISRPFEVTRGLMTLCGTAAASVGVGLALLSIHWILLPLLVLGGVPALFTSRRESRREFSFTVGQTPSERLRYYLTWLQTGRDEAKEIRAFNLAPSLRTRFDAAYDQYLSALTRHLQRRTALNVAGNLASALALTVTLLVLVWLISDGQVSVAAAGAAIVGIRMLASQVQILFGAMQQIFECGLFLDDVEEFLRMGPAAAREEGGRTPPKDFRTVSAEAVTFSYPESSRAALTGVDIRIGEGEVIALVGKNGSGKTTLAKILPVCTIQTRGRSAGMASTAASITAPLSGSRSR